MPQPRLMPTTVTRLSALAIALALMPGTAAGRDGGTPGLSGSVDIRVSVAPRLAVRPLTHSGGSVTGRPCLASNGAPLPLMVEMHLLDTGPAASSGPEVNQSKDMARFPIGGCGADLAGSAGPLPGNWSKGPGLLLIRPE